MSIEASRASCMMVRMLSFRGPFGPNIRSPVIGWNRSGAYTPGIGIRVRRRRLDGGEPAPEPVLQHGIERILLARDDRDLAVLQRGDLQYGMSSGPT